MASKKTTKPASAPPAPAKKTPAKKAPRRKYALGILNENNILTGIRRNGTKRDWEAAAAAILALPRPAKPGVVPVPDGCDLCDHGPGRYVWVPDPDNDMGGAFVPRSTDEAVVLDESPDLREAIAALMITVMDLNGDLPEVCADWLVKWSVSLDRPRDARGKPLQSLATLYGAEEK